jgi:crotonobetainyl-CoA:carnitine CoA-transferase CaiB-like acyl-CoA transferase
MRIVSIAQNAPGPVAVARLVAGGATAIKIEPPWGDQIETLCKSWYDELHTGVSVERLDLKAAEGMTRLHALLATADVLLASQRPSALARLGLDAPTLHRTYPSLRHVTIVGDTANPEEPGHDLTSQARAGLLGAHMPSTLLADMACAERVVAVILALMPTPGEARRVGLADVLSDLAAPLTHGLTAAGGPLSGSDPAYRIYPAKGGAVAVAALEPHFRAALYAGLGLGADADLSPIFLTRTAREWEEWATARDIPLVEVRHA